MIVPMTKARILALESHKSDSTKELKNLGLLHPEITVTSSEKIERLREKISGIDRALGLLPEPGKDQVYPQIQEDEAEDLVARVLNLGASLKKLFEEREKLTREESRWSNWGDFDPSIIESLRDTDYPVNLLSLGLDEWKTFKKRYAELPLFEVRRLKAGVLICVVGEVPEEFLGSLIDPPDQSLNSMRTRITKIDNEISELTNHLSTLDMESNQLAAFKQKLEDQVEFATVEENFHATGPVLIISGFLPSNQVDALKKTAAKNSWGLTLEEPDSNEQVPTLTKNPPAVRIIQPVFDLLGTIPGYREHDISLWFLMFFTVFFAFIIGDAGYGALLLVVSIILSLKQSRTGTVGDGLKLFTLLSFATVVWGAITGNWFAYEPISRLPGFRDLIIPSINTYTQGSADTVKLICFVIGTVHIVIAHSIQFFRKITEKPYIHAFGQIGWMVTVLGLYYLVLNVVISSSTYPVPDFAVPMIGIGMGLVFLFENQSGEGFFRGVLSSLANVIPTLLSGVSSFSDIISYIRLYAVGLSGFAIAQSFNSMAQGMMESGIGGIIAGIVVVMLGHTLNLAMAGLSVVVHGVRLNMLEFSNHVGNEWAGFAYKPFKEQIQ